MILMIVLEDRLHQITAQGLRAAVILRVPEQHALEIPLLIANPRARAVDLVVTSNVWWVG